MSLATQMRRAAAGVSVGGGAFNPETDITWHSLFWAEGTDFQAQGYTDTDTVTNWPNETGETDAASSPAWPTFDASNPDLNGQPAVDFSTSNGTRIETANFSTPPSYPISVVVIGKFGAGSGLNDALFDGNDSTNRNSILIGSGSTWRIFATSGTVQGGTSDTNPHLFVGYFDGSTGNERLDVDGTTVTSGSDAGSAQLDGLRIGNLRAGTFSCEGHIAMLGIYEGDITADGSWGDFTTWVEDHYGLSIA